VQRFGKQMEIGMRWLSCGWRLFLRNPWQLSGMGLTAAVGVGALMLVPLVGTLLIALLAPALLGSAYLAADALARQKMALPRELRLPAFTHAPREFLRVFGNEAWVMPTIVACFYSMAVALLVSILVRAIAGNAWVAGWSDLAVGPLLAVLGAGLLALLVYALLAASLVYALPLAFLQDEPLLPALGRSLKASVGQLFALLAVFGLLLAALLFTAIAAQLSIWVAILAWLIAGTVALPVVVAALYCSYRTMFTVREAARAA
jgi:hypothetical protein